MTKAGALYQIANAKLVEIPDQQHTQSVLPRNNRQLAAALCSQAPLTIVSLDCPGR